jgi:hypothetical protein
LVNRRGDAVRRPTLASLEAEVAMAERQLLAESCRYVQRGPQIPVDAHARLQHARRRLELARQALQEFQAQREPELARFALQT